MKKTLLHLILFGTTVIAPPQALGAPDPFKVGGDSGNPATANLQVLVTDANGRPKPGANVRLRYRGTGGSMTTTATPDEDGRVVEDNHQVNADGRIAIASLKPGKADVLIQLDALTRGAQVRLVGGRVTTLTVVIPSPKTVVQGSVRHIDKGPLGKVKLQLKRIEAETDKGWLPDTYSAVTNAKGHYHVDAVPRGTYSVTLRERGTGRATPMGGLVVTWRPTTKRDFVVGRVSLSGTVINAQDQRPLLEARVQISKLAGTDRQLRYWSSTKTDADGNFRFLDLPTGTYRLSVSKDGFAVHWNDLGKVVAGKKREVDIRLDPAAVLHIYLSDAKGRPVSGTFFLVAMKDSERKRWAQGEKAASQPHSIRTDAEGAADLRKLVPGKYRLWILRPASEIARVNITAGENVVRLKLKNS